MFFNKHDISDAAAEYLSLPVSSLFFKNPDACHVVVFSLDATWRCEQSKIAPDLVEFVCTDSLAAGSRLVAASMPDLVLVDDCFLEEGGAMRVIKTILAAAPTPPRFAVIAKRIEKSLIVEAMRMAVIDILAKPIRDTDIRSVLRRVADISTNPTQLDELRAHVSTLRSQLNNLWSTLEAHVPPPVAPAKPLPPTISFSVFLESKLSEARMRRAICAFAGDAAWIMMLDLLVSKRAGKRVPTSSAAIASGDPMTTALRMIRDLHDRGALEIRRDTNDARRRYVALSPKTEKMMLEVLEEEYRQKYPTEVIRNPLDERRVRAKAWIAR